MYEVGDHFLYYGKHTSLHGEIGLVLSKKTYPTNPVPYYEAVLIGDKPHPIGQFAVFGDRGMRPYNRTPDWEV